MELDIFHLDCFPSCRPTGGLEHGLVVETEPELGHAGEVTFHLDGTKDFGPENVAVGGYQ